WRTRPGRRRGPPSARGSSRRRAREARPSGLPALLRERHQAVPRGHALLPAPPPRLGQALLLLGREGGVVAGVDDARTPAGERRELPAPLVAGRLLPLRRGTPGDLPPLAEGDDMVVAHPAVAVRHHEHVADGADSLPGRGLGEIVVAVPAWLLGGIGDEGEERV